MQENKLVKQSHDTYLNDLLNKNLARKSKKKEQDLLIYKSESFKLKRELDNIID